MTSSYIGLDGQRHWSNLFDNREYVPKDHVASAISEGRWDKFPDHKKERLLKEREETWKNLTPEQHTKYKETSVEKAIKDGHISYHHSDDLFWFESYAQSTTFTTGTITPSEEPPNFGLCKQYMSGKYYFPEITVDSESIDLGFSPKRYETIYADHTNVCSSSISEELREMLLGDTKSIENISKEIKKKYDFINKAFFSIKEDDSIDHIKDEDIEKIIEKVIDLKHEY